MKKKIICKILYIASALLLFFFVVASCVDAYKYHIGAYLGSAPLYLYFLLRGVQFLLPSLIVFVVGLIFKRKCVKK